MAAAWAVGAGGATPTAPVSHRPNFSDLQQGFQRVNNGELNDNTVRNGILILMAVVGVVALVIHLKQRRESAQPPDSLRSLSWSMSRLVRFPMGSRMVLWWVARSNKLPVAALMLSSVLFDKSVASWSGQATFSAARRWGKGRLIRLRRVLFDAPATAPNVQDA